MITASVSYLKHVMISLVKVWLLVTIVNHSIAYTTVHKFAKLGSHAIDITMSDTCDKKVT